MPRLWLVVALGAIGIMGLAGVPNAIDLAYHVKAGQLMVAEHALPRTDVLAWTTAGRPWLDQNWGAQLVLYGIWRLGGFPLLTVVNALLAVAAWGLVTAACRRRTANLRLVAGAILLGYATAVATFSARPQMFSLLLFATELYLLEVARTRPRVALAIPLLMPLWANLHGAFAVGIGLLVIEAVAAAWRRDRPGILRYLLVAVASIAGLLVNPWGVRVLGYALSLPTNRGVSGMISEWAPPACATCPGSCSCSPLGCWSSPWSGPQRPSGCRSSCSGWRCWAGSRSGWSEGSPGWGWPCRWPCARWPGSTRPGLSPPTALCRCSTA